MTGTTRGLYCAVDRSTAEVVVAPWLAGVDEQSRVAIYDHGAGRYVVTGVVPAGGTWRLPLRDVAPLGAYSIKLQTRGPERWQDAFGPSRMSMLGDLSLASVTPRAWGVTTPCVVVLRDTYTRTELLRVSVGPDAVVECVLDGQSGTQRVQLDFLEPEGTPRAGTRLLPPIRLVPTERAGRPAPRLVDETTGLAHARRRDVTLAPVLLKAAPKGGLATYGFLGAWEGDEPVVEAMEFVLGRQRFLYQPTIPDAVPSEGAAIYLGLPHASWGHFLTQGLARVWYALQHPEIPVVWDARSLPPYQQAVLDLLGMTNQQIFLDKPMRFDEVVFPYPGISLGDYVTPAFARNIGRIPARRGSVPGVRLFLSRAGTGGRGGLEGSLDAELDELVQRYGFTVFRPEEHSLAQQLDALSSAEVVLGIEGSALHSVLLLQDPVSTAFWALSRHRGGAGVFQHIKSAKSLRYETLNFLREPMGGARGSIDLDLVALEDALRRTDGLTRDLHLLDDRLEDPVDGQTSYEAHLGNCQVGMNRLERDLADAMIKLRSRDVEGAAGAISWYL